MKRSVGIGFAALVLMWSVLGAEGAPLAYQGPLPPPTAGYGAWGEHEVAPPLTFDFVTQGYTNTLTLYYPEDQVEAAATLFFAPGWNVPCEGYAELLRFWASKGYVALCDDYHEDSGAIGAQLRESFIEAARRYPNRVDTAQVGLAGHSAGAGLLPSVAYALIRDEGWGDDGFFIFSSAPWIDFDMTDAMAADFPTQVKLIVQTYEEDTTTDLRTYIQAFEPLPIPDTEKEYITLRSTTVGDYTYRADHGVIGTSRFDALDYEGVFRLLEALADYTFNGSEAGKRVALGDGVEAQIEMKGLRDLISTDDPRPIPGLATDYPCDVEENPRRLHCNDYDDELPASVLVEPVKHALLRDVSHPLFRWEPSPTATDYYLQVRPLLDSGEPDWTVSYGESVTADEAGCADGTTLCAHTLSSALTGGRYVWWILPSNATKDGVWSRRGYFSLPTDFIFLPLVVNAR